MLPRDNAQITPRSSEVNDVYFNGAVTYFQDNGDQYGAGFMFRLPEYHYSFVNAANFSRNEFRKSSETGVWFKYKLKQFQPFSVELGVRSDLFSILSPNNSDAFEPRVGFSYDVSQFLAFKLSYARVHQRVVTITNEDDVVSLFETWIPIDEDEPSQQADHYIAGIDGSLGFLPGLTFNLQDITRICRISSNTTATKWIPPIRISSAPTAVPMALRCFSRNVTRATTAWCPTP